MKNHYLSIILILFLYSTTTQGQDPLTNYQFSIADEAPWNSIITGTGPFGDNVTLLENIGDDGYNGFYIEDILVSSNTSYRFSFWTKLTEINPVYYGGWIRPKDSNGNILSDGIVYDDQTTDDGIFMFSGNTPIVPLPNEWYLFVGFVKANTDGASYTGSIYDTSGAIVANLSEQNVKWNVNVTKLDYRSISVYSAQTPNKSYFFDPRIQVTANGDFSVDDLLPQNTQIPSNGTSVWAETNSVASYTGKVGIGTTTPGEYELAVNGEIRAKEIKVETANWPDYVFTKEYRLPSLEEVQKHINQNGHLINIPSALEIERIGIGRDEQIAFGENRGVDFIYNSVAK